MKYIALGFGVGVAAAFALVGFYATKTILLWVLNKIVELTGGTNEEAGCNNATVGRNDPYEDDGK